MWENAFTATKVKVIETGQKEKASTFASNLSAQQQAEKGSKSVEPSLQSAVPPATEVNSGEEIITTPDEDNDTSLLCLDDQVV